MIVYLFSPTGMLGHQVYKTLLKNNYDVWTFGRRQSKFNFDFITDLNFINQLYFYEGSYLINCAGLVPQKSNNDDYKPLNVELPKFLNKLCTDKKLKFIHISSDCVFSGRRGNYNENETDIDYNEDYGLSKLYGDYAVDNGLILRTSFIGPELDSKVGLYEWFNHTELDPIPGFMNCYWNGLSTKELSKIILKIIQNNLYEPKLYHIHSPNILSKCQLLEEFNKKQCCKDVIKPILHEQTINRSLKTLWPDFLNQFNIPDLYTQIEEM